MRSKAKGGAKAPNEHRNILEAALGGIESVPELLPIRPSKQRKFSKATIFQQLTIE